MLAVDKGCGSRGDLCAGWLGHHSGKDACRHIMASPLATSTVSKPMTAWNKQVEWIMFIFVWVSKTKAVSETKDTRWTFCYGLVINSLKCLIEFTMLRPKQVSPLLFLPSNGYFLSEQTHVLCCIILREAVTIDYCRKENPCLAHYTTTHKSCQLQCVTCVFIPCTHTRINCGPAIRSFVIVILQDTSAR